MKNIQNSYKFIHELRIIFGIHKTVILCVQENPNTHMNKEKTEKKRKELSLEPRDQKVNENNSKYLPASSLFLNTLLLSLSTDCGDTGKDSFTFSLYTLSHIQIV